MFILLNCLFSQHMYSNNYKFARKISEKTKQNNQHIQTLERYKISLCPIPGQINISFLIQSSYL